MKEHRIILASLISKSMKKVSRWPSNCKTLIQLKPVVPMRFYQDSYNLLKWLPDSQYGLGERLSTVIQLITSVHDWASTLKHRDLTDVILLDFSKVKVSHHHLSSKLIFFHGIRGSTQRWTNAFLADRQQAVSVNGIHSPLGEVTSGVQGLVLGPAS